MIKGYDGNRHQEVSMAVGYVGFIYVIILLAGKSIWERFHVCKFLVGDAKEFYTIVASG